MEELIKIRKVLEENNLHFSPMTDIYVGLRVVSIEVIDGDWKHDHWALDRVLNENGYKCIKEITIGESEDDYYSSKHCYMPTSTWEGFHRLFATK